MASSNTHESDAAKYDSSTDKEIDDKLDMLAEITLASCGNLRLYIDKQTAVIDELSSVNLQPDQWKKAAFRHGLPHHLRIAASVYVPPPDVSDPTNIKLDLIGSLSAAQRRFSEYQPPLAAPSSCEEGDDAICEPLSTTKRQRGNSPQGNETTDPAGTTSTVAKRRKRKNANATETIHRANMKMLAQPKNQGSVSVKPGPSSDDKKVNLYFLGPLKTAYSVFPYLVEFATNIPRDGPLAMNVATLPKQKLMTQVINLTVISYARSRTNQFLTNVPLDVSSQQQETIEPVDLSQDLLKEPTYITQARTLDESLARVSELWRQKQSMAVHQKILESWAINVIHNVAGLKVGETPNRNILAKIKRAAQQLMPVLRPSHMQGTGAQTIIRTQYYWTLLAEFRSKGVPFIVAYRPSTVDTILLSDGANRLKGEDILAWVPTIQAVERHVTAWFDALEGVKGRSDLKVISNSILAPSQWGSLFDQDDWNCLRQNATNSQKSLHPMSALDLATYGYHGFISRRKVWSVMEAPGTQKSIAISDIPEACFLGIVSGILRWSGGFAEGCISGPDGMWLDTRQSQGSLSKIDLGSSEETNTVLAWHMAGDCRAPWYQTAWVLAFSSRPIGIFQPLVRWNGEESAI